MSTDRVVLLGAIAGFTIFLGLPIARLRSPRPALRSFLNAVAIGILVFLLFDILAHANETVEAALVAASQDHTGSWARFFGLAAVFAGGLGVGLISLVYYDRHMKRRSAQPARSVGAAAVAQSKPDQTTAAGAAVHSARFGWWVRSDAQQLALLIAVGIGLHNFSEGLAIGQSAAQDEIALATMLVIGFALHNATEGFGIVAPFANEERRPSWGMLLVLGLIGGGPTVVGTILGHSFVNDTLALLFLALAAGSILYVVIQLVQMAGRMGHKEMLMWGVFLGLVLGFATDYVLVAAGA